MIPMLKLLRPMSVPFAEDLLWVAQRHGQDWRDEDVIAAVEWLTSLVPSDEWMRRIAAVLQ